MKKEIFKLYNEGKNYTEISKILKCSKGTISYHLKDIRNFTHEDYKNGENLICTKCGKQYYRKRSKVLNSKFCSNSCKMSYMVKINPDFYIECGKKSVQSQKNIKRSKNEIYFNELCNQYFEFVKNNEPIFNGWDADIILPVLKIAVLWNGKWHYEKITKNHSVKQVKNRDIIKEKEIIKCGYTPYIIKDLGKYNKNFVEQEFDKFIKYIAD